MAIQVSGVNVIDDQRNLNVGVLTATSLDVPPQAITFSPTDGSSDVSLSSNIVITFNADVEKGSGNITLREGSASGTVIETIAVSSGSVTISGGQVTINPSDFPTGKDIYVVVDDGAFTSTALGAGTNLINTYNFTTGPITVSSFVPSDATSGVSVSNNLIINFTQTITKGSGNITIRSGSASGTIQQTIDVTSAAVTITGSDFQATINPPSDLAYETDTYIVVDAGCFRNSDGDAASGNALINNWNFTTESDIPPLGSAYEGGYLICKKSSVLWIIAPSSSEVRRTWYERTHSNTRAQQVSGCTGWFVPSGPMLFNPFARCRTYWDSFSGGSGNSVYWGNSETTPSTTYANAWTSDLVQGNISYTEKTTSFYVRSLRCVTY